MCKVKQFIFQLIFYIAILAGIFSCNNSSSSRGDMSDFFNHNNSLPLKNTTTYKHYEGTLGSHKIYFDLSIGNADIAATYFIDSTEEVLDIFGRIYSNDSIFLEDYKQNYASKENNEKNNYFKGRIIDDGFEGLFISPTNSIPFKTKEITNNTVVANFIKIADSTIDTNSKKTIIHANFECPFFEDNQYDFIYEHIYKLMGDSNYHGTFKDFITKKTKYNSIDFNKNELIEMANKPNLSADYCYIMYNKNNRLILSNSKMFFWIGMHENFDVRFCTIDMTLKKSILIQDVLSPDEIALLPTLLEKKFRITYGLSEKDSLNKILYYNDNRFLNDNYYITDKGIGFLYNPQEIASFTMGPITLYIPFTEIRK